MRLREKYQKDLRALLYAGGAIILYSILVRYAMPQEIRYAAGVVYGFVVCKINVNRKSLDDER